jgi:hypothetical protein
MHFEETLHADQATAVCHQCIQLLQSLWQVHGGGLAQRPYCGVCQCLAHDFMCASTLSICVAVLELAKFGVVVGCHTAWDFFTFQLTAFVGPGYVGSVYMFVLSMCVHDDARGVFNGSETS